MNHVFHFHLIYFFKCNNHYVSCCLLSQVTHVSELSIDFISMSFNLVKYSRAWPIYFLFYLLMRACRRYICIGIYATDLPPIWTMNNLVHCERCMLEYEKSFTPDFFYSLVSASASKNPYWSALKYSVKFPRKKKRQFFNQSLPKQIFLRFSMEIFSISHFALSLKLWDHTCFC